MRQDNSRQWRELGDRVAQLADGVAGCATRALQLGAYPPAAVVIGERDLWRWAAALQRTSTPPATTSVTTPDTTEYVAVALLVAIDGHRDPIAVGDAIRRTAAPGGGWWRVCHVTAYPDPAAIFGVTIPPDPDRDRDCDQPTTGGGESR